MVSLDWLTWGGMTDTNGAAGRCRFLRSASRAVLGRSVSFPGEAYARRPLSGYGMLPSERPFVQHGALYPAAVLNVRLDSTRSGFSGAYVCRTYPAADKR